MNKEKSVVMPEDKTSLIKVDDIPKLITLRKLNGLNYFAQVLSVKSFLRGKNKLKNFDNKPSNIGASNHKDWMSGDSIVM